MPVVKREKVDENDKFLLPSGSIVGMLTARLQVQVAEAPVIELLAEVLHTDLRKE